MSLIKKIKQFYKEQEKPLLFTTPSHSQGDFIPQEAEKLLGRNFYNCDFSEIDGFDNLRNPESILFDLQKKIANIVKAKDSFILTNGSTSGIEALMLALLKENEKVLIARNSHVSVYNGLVLTGAMPIWILPEYDNNWGLYKGIDANNIEKELKNYTEIKCVIVTSPTYEGIYSDIEKISKVTKKYGVKLIVDEAHGALTQFADNGRFKAKSAIKSGADAAVQSLHKTAGAPNPCALLSISKSSDIESSKIQNALNIINTTSPSYPLITAVEATVNYLSSKEGKNHINKLLTQISNLKEKLKDKYDFYNDFNDTTKLLIRHKKGNSLKIASLLNNKYNIEEEFSTENYLLFITGIGTSNDKLNKLANVLSQIEVKNTIKNTLNYKYDMPDCIYSPRKAYFKETTNIKTKYSAGKICAEIIMNYPPGIPILIPGEIIKPELLKIINKDVITVID